VGLDELGDGLVDVVDEDEGALLVDDVRRGW